MSRLTVRSGEVDLAVFEGGDPDGPTVLLVHGWPDTHHLWRGVVEQLAPQFHVVAYDTRGQGESSDPGSDRAFTLPLLAQDLFAVAEAVSADRPVHVLAHDWGSVQAWEAVCEPGAERRIASFTSISGPNLDHLAHWVRRNLLRPTPERVARLARQAGSSAYVWFFVSPLAPPLMRRFATVERWRSLLTRMEREEPAPDEVANTLPDDMVSGLRYYRANIGLMPRRPRERRTSVPVLLLVPEHDPAIREFVHEEVPRWVERLERVDVPYGHWVPMTRPDVVAAEAARFIRSVEASDGEAP